MELPTQATEVQAGRLVPRQSFGVLPIASSLREYVAAVKQRRAHGIMTLEEIGNVVMELVPQHNRILPQRSRSDRKELIKTVANLLEFPEVAFKRIDEAIRRLEDSRKICADSDCVWRSKP